ncbi:mpv17-like protein 2 [Mercenaria mercenaria]|uniref:mpv17-like protein 2 n=1 Tax=Mercenaria mercenaria TaxID=6596 RepID=UPI00234F9637|nr:mpv17-like protein 2 [Mercenaria mercenaria]
MSATALKFYNHPSVLTVRSKFKKLFSQKYLLYTNTTISLLMSCAGDGLQQNYQIVNKEIASWDKRRSKHVAVTGFLIGPFCHYWYIFLDWWLPGRSVRVVTKKLLVDQLICSPIAITSFLSVTSYLEGKRGKELKNELLEKGKTLYAAEWIVWPPAQVINFCFLPTRYRVLFDNTVSFGFDWYFSYVKYGKHPDSQENVLEKSRKEDIEDKAVDINQYGAHVPFLHIQAANTVQAKLEHMDWDNWNEWFYRGRHERDLIEEEVTETSTIGDKDETNSDQTDSEPAEVCLSVGKGL